MTNEESQAQLVIEQLENQSGLTYDPRGPEPKECDYCGKWLQYIPDHDCYGIRGESHEAARDNTYRQE